MVARPLVDARLDGRQFPSRRYLSCVRRTPHFTCVRMVYDACPDKVCFKEGRMPNFLSAADNSLKVHIFSIKIGIIILCFIIILAFYI